MIHKIQGAVEKDTPRKARLLGKFSKTMDKHAHLVVPSLSMFWRVRQEDFVKRLEVAKVRPGGQEIGRGEQELRGQTYR